MFLTWYDYLMEKQIKSQKPLTEHQKSVLDKAVKKTVKQYGETLDLLAKT